MSMQDSAEEGWQGFLKLCCLIQTPAEFEQCLNLFLTIEEKETLASRYLIIQALLQEKLTQRMIAEKYGVSISQITRGSNALKIIDGSLRAFLKKQVKD